MTSTCNGPSGAPLPMAWRSLAIALLGAMPRLTVSFCHAFGASARFRRIGTATRLASFLSKGLRISPSFRTDCTKAP